ncbi:acetylglutamate kinase [Clostridium botulinum]|uniref:acetylglutamate kinase n=1 Tax=Clostridium botulinum TaxID=1491 RepID=UPI001FA91468|nr:acetylglutamate kinase [Clostridium botulinum]
MLRVTESEMALRDTLRMLWEQHSVWTRLAIMSIVAGSPDQDLVIAAELVKASKAGNTDAAADAEKRWYENADQIAELLSKINPYWHLEDWQAMLHEHLALVKAEAVAILTSDYEKGISIYDDLEMQALEMAAMMADGIVKQFPERFQD